MIISNSHKFIFFHIPKTGGTALCYNLCRYSENLTVFPQLQVVLDTLDKQYPNIKPRVLDKLIKDAISTIPDHYIADFYNKNKKMIHWMNVFHYNFNIHPLYFQDNATQYLMKRQSGKLFGKHFKFAMVRNPWDYTYSVFKNKIVGGNLLYGLFGDLDDGVTLEHFNYFIEHIDDFPQIAKTFVCPLRCQSNYILDKWGNNHLDHIARFEDYDKEVEFLSNKLNVDIDKTVVLNKSNVTTVPYTEMYSNTSIDIIGEIFRKDVDLFGYTFGSK
jgi:hypothetical protein